MHVMRRMKLQSAATKRCMKFVERLDEFLDAFRFQLSADGLHVDAELVKIRPDAMRLFDAVAKSKRGLPMIAIGFECGVGQCIHRVRSDERLHVLDIDVFGVLG